MTDRDRPDWLLPYYPELRSGPPWVTEDMIAAEPSLAEIVDALAAPAGEVAEAARTAAEAGEPVVVVGSGTAEWAAAGLAELLDDGLRAAGLDGGAVEARESLEASLDPREGGLVVGVSHGGRSRSTVAALEAARATGARTVLVTADREAPAAAAADHVLVTPLRDRSFCHTVAYLSPILVGGALAGALAGAPVERAALAAHLEAALALRDGAFALARALGRPARLLAVGGGCDAIAAGELALKVEEAVRIPATARRLEALLHGHLVAADAETALVLLLTEPRHRDARAERAEAALAASRRVGVPCAAIAAPGVASRFGDELADAGVLVVPETPGVPPLLASLSASALALQLLTMGMVHEAGVNPDLIRREEASYREAAELTRAKIR